MELNRGRASARTLSTEWIAASKDNPEAVGYTDAEAIEVTMLGTYYYGDDAANAAACLNAAAQGVQIP